MTPAIIAHRGASALAAHENSLESFQIAIDLGADYAEFDIRQTKDKQLIVFHDSAYEEHSIDSLTYEELNLLTSKKGLLVPLFQEVLNLCKGKIKLDIELKESGFEKEVIKMVTKDFSYDTFMIKSFLDECVANIHSIDPSIKKGLLLGKAKAGFITRLTEYFPMKRVKKCHADFVSPNKRFITRGFLLRMKKAEKDVYAWTVNHPTNIKSLLKHKVTGIITDRPDIALKLRDNI